MAYGAVSLAEYHNRSHWISGRFAGQRGAHQKENVLRVGTRLSHEWLRLLQHEPTGRATKFENER